MNIRKSIKVVGEVTILYKISQFQTQVFEQTGEIFKIMWINVNIFKWNYIEEWDEKIRKIKVDLSVKRKKIYINKGLHVTNMPPHTHNEKWKWNEKKAKLWKSHTKEHHKIRKTNNTIKEKGVR